MSKVKHFEATEETHKMAKEQSAVAGMGIRDYVRQCIIMCKSDAGVMRLSKEEKHKAIMKVFGLNEEYSREDIIATTLQEIYDFIMELKVVA